MSGAHSSHKWLVTGVATVIGEPTDNANPRHKGVMMERFRILAKRSFDPSLGNNAIDAMISA